MSNSSHGVVANVRDSDIFLYLISGPSKFKYDESKYNYQPEYSV